MVTSQENRKAIICLHQNGLSPKEIAQQGLANIRTVQESLNLGKKLASPYQRKEEEDQKSPTSGKFAS